MRRVNTLLALASWLVVVLWTAPVRARGAARTSWSGWAPSRARCSAVTIVDWTTNNMLEHIYDRLLDRDAKTLKPKPMLATGWKVVNDTTWEFTLRQGVKFHNGEPFNAHSVKATIEYALDPASKTPLRGGRLLEARQGGPDRQRLHGALHHRQAVAEPHRPRLADQLAS